MNRSTLLGGAALAITSLTLALAGCAGPGGSPGPSRSAGTETPMSIAYSVEALDETQSNIAAQMKLRVQELNDEGVPVTFDVFGADNSVDRQNNDIEAIVTRQTGALVVTTVDPAGSVSALEAAHDAGVKVVDVRGNIDSDKMDVVYLGLDEPKMGALLKQQAVAYLEANPDAVLKYGLIMGGDTFTTTHVRVQTIKDLAKEMPDRVQILVEDYGDWTTEKATSLMEDWSVRYPEMNALASSSDEMTLGAVNVLRARDTLDDFFILSVNGSDNGLRMVADGDIDATIGIDFAEYGRGMIEAAVASLRGEIATGDVFDYSEKVNVVVDASNVEAYAAKKKADDAAAAALG